MTLRVVFDRDIGLILGAQVTGLEGVDKRIDVLATCIQAAMTMHDLEHLELSYAPQYSSAKGPINVAGFVGGQHFRRGREEWRRAGQDSCVARTHLISLGSYLFFLLVRIVLFSRRLLPFALLNPPAWAIEFWFERTGRPVYTETAKGKELQKAGEALDAKGLTKWMWDVVYRSWSNTVLTAPLGNWAWWLLRCSATVLSVASVFTYFRVRSGFSGMSAGAGGEGSGGAAARSKRQAELR
ncbi:hypothetical protein LTR81_027590 [Elasticomyces elasticus]